jgi:putative aldouronate transport system substrate-binding protein
MKEGGFRMKKKILSKIMAAALAGAMAMGVLTACGGDAASTAASSDAAPAASSEAAPAASSDAAPAASSEATPAATPAVAGMEGWEAFAENVTITVPVYDRGKAGYPAVDNNYWTKWIQTEFGDKYNVTVQYVAIPRNDVMTKYSMLIAAQDTPTILMEYDYPKVTQWANDGAMQPYDIEAFKQVAPTYYQSMVDNDQLVYTDVGGETYFVLSERPYYQTPYTFVQMARLDWLKQVGYDSYPTDYDKLADAIAKIIDAGLTDIAPINFTLPSDANTRNFMNRAFPMNEEEWAIYASLGTPNFTWDPTYRILKQYNEEYRAGWYSTEFELDLDSTAGTQAETDFVNGKLFRYGNYMSSTVTWLNSFYENNPDGELTVVQTPTPGSVLSPYQQSNTLRADNPFGMIIGFSSLASEDQLKAAWMLMERMIQPDVLFTLENGVEGVNFNYNDQGIAEQINLEGTGNEMMMNHNSNIDMTCLVRAAKVVGDTIEDAVRAVTPQGIPQDFYQEILDNYYAQREVADAGQSYTDPIFAVAIDAESEYNATLLTMWQEYFAKLVKADPEEFDAMYEGYKQDFLDAGYQEILDERLAAYQAGQTTKLPDASK